MKTGERPEEELFIEEMKYRERKQNKMLIDPLKEDVFQIKYGRRTRDSDHHNRHK